MGEILWKKSNFKLISLRCKIIIQRLLVLLLKDWIYCVYPRFVAIFAPPNFTHLLQSRPIYYLMWTAIASWQVNRTTIVDLHSWDIQSDLLVLRHMNWVAKPLLMPQFSKFLCHYVHKSAVSEDMVTYFCAFLVSTGRAPKRPSFFSTLFYGAQLLF